MKRLNPLIAVVLRVLVVFGLAGCATKPAMLGERIGGYQHVAFSPDGHYLATSRIRVGWWHPLASESIVFDVASRTERWRFKPDKKSNARALVGLAYAPEGRLLAAYSGDKSVMVWDASTSNLVCRLALSDEPRRCVLSPDGRWLATAAKQKPPTIWEVAAARKLVELTNCPILDGALVFSRDGRWLAAAGLCQGICICDIAAGQRISQLPPPKGDVRYLAFAPDGTRLAISADDVSVLCLTNSDLEETIPAPSMGTGAKVAGMLFMLASTLGGAPSGSSEVFSTAPSGPVAFSPAGTHLAIINSAANVDTAFAHGARQVRIFELSGANLISTVSYNTRVGSIAFSPDGKLIATAGEAVDVWDWTNAQGKMAQPTAFAPVLVHLQTNLSSNLSWPPGHSVAKQVCVGAFADARGRVTLGERTTSFKVKMSDILPSRPVADSLRDAVAILFARAAQPAGKLPATLNIVGAVRKFSVQTPASLVSWEIEAEVELELQITNATGSVVHAANYRGLAKRTTFVWPSECLIEQTCNDALRHLLENIRNDPVWQTL